MISPRPHRCGTDQAVGCLLNELSSDGGDGLSDSTVCQLCDKSLHDLEHQLSSVGKRLGQQVDTELRGEAKYLKQIERDAAPLRSLTTSDNSSEFSRPHFIGQYELIEPLGQGGMGQVFRARHRKLNKIVALKIIRGRGKISQSRIARFEREIQAVGQLDHPNVVRALDAGEADGVSFLSMELVDGIDLAKVADDGTLSVADACEILRQTSLGLQFAHDGGLIHRDIKPSNLMLCRDAVGNIGVKILDLGLAMIANQDRDSERLTDAGHALGTLRFMSPEQIEDTRTVDHRTDIYSLGAAIYRLLVGELPFAGIQNVSPAKYIQELTTSDAPSVASVRDDLPAELVKLIDGMLARDPQQRTSDLHDVIQVAGSLSRSHRLGELLTRLQSDAAANRDPAIYSFRHASLSPASFEFSNQDPAQPQLGKIGILLQRVKKFWIDGVLQRSTLGEGTLALPKEMRPSAVWNPWEGVAEAEPEDVTAKTDLTIGEIFAESHQSLLILGNPGSGKTTTLLELTRDLVRTAECNANSPVPVVLHLSTWTDPTESLEAWIESELSAKYQIPRRITRQWLNERRLILLLDGLDEVRSEIQSMCVENINHFIGHDNPPGVTVSCRTTDYTALTNKLKLTAAVELKSLSSAQILSSIDESNASNASLGLALHKHEALRDLAKSPLMLGLMKLTYKEGNDESSIGLERGTLAEVQEQLFDTYITRMFRRKSKSDDDYSPEQTVSALQWLARQMDDRQQSVLMIEELQPNWLANTFQRAVYGISLSLILGLLTALATTFFWSQAMVIMDASESMSATSLLWLFLQIPVWYLMITALDFSLFRKPASDAIGRWKRVSRATTKTILYLALWIVWPIAGSVIGLWSSGWVVSNVMIGIVISASIGAIGSARRVMVDVATVESLGISARRSLQGWGWGLLVGYVVYLTYLTLWAFVLLDELPDWFPFYWHSTEELYVSISWPLLWGSVGLVVGGLTPRVTKGKTTPNQGMRMSVRNAGIAAAFSSVIVALTTTVVLYGWLWLPQNTIQMSTTQKFGVVVGFSAWVSFFAAMSYGGLDLLKHLLIRWILKASGQIPNGFVEFLEHAARLNFLQRVGGSYMFGHRLLQEHFARGNTQQIANN